MAAIEWDATGKRYYETGLSHGVLFPMNDNGTYATGVPWNGMTGFTESPGGAELTDLWADDIKYASLRSRETFGGTLEAYTYPDEFMECDGSAEPVTGLRLGQQKRRNFGLTYQTQKNSDVVADDDKHFLLHIIYNANCAPSEKSYQTVNDSPEAISFSWELNTTPVTVTGYKPVSTIVIDSEKFLTSDGTAIGTKLQALLDKLYGTANTDPELPTPAEVIAMLGDTPTPGPDPEDEEP